MSRGDVVVVIAPSLSGFVFDLNPHIYLCCPVCECMCDKLSERNSTSAEYHINLSDDDTYQWWEWYNVYDDGDE